MRAAPLQAPGRSALQNALPAAFALAAWLASGTKLIAWALGLAPNPGLWRATYTYSILAPNYFNSGFVRRGLGGTVLALVDWSHTANSVGYFHIVSAAFLAAPCGVLLWKLSRRATPVWIWLGIVLVFSPQLFRGWRMDLGRADMLTFGFVAWALVATVSRRYLIAAVLVVLGSLVHETAVFFGAPLCIAIAYVDRGAAQDARSRGLLALALLFALLVAASLAEHAVGPSPPAVARTVIASGPPERYRYIAAYMTAEGFRTILTSACMSFSRPAAWLYLVANLVVWAMYLVVLPIRSRRALLVVAFASLLPMIALSTVAVDYGRWLQLAVFTAWLAVVAMETTSSAEPVPVSGPRLAAAAVGLTALVAMGHATYAYANTFTFHMAARIWPARSEQMDYYLDRCDPQWMASLGAASLAER